jgi:hypothetical protein
LPPQATSDPPSPTFEIYQTVTSTSDHPDGIESAPHLARIRNDLNNPILFNRTPSTPNLNVQASGPSMFSSSPTDGQSPPFFPPDIFLKQPHFDTTYPQTYRDGYNHPASQDMFVQTPAPFSQSNLPHEDIAGFPH